MVNRLPNETVVGGESDVASDDDGTPIEDADKHDERCSGPEGEVEDVAVAIGRGQ